VPAHQLSMSTKREITERDDPVSSRGATCGRSAHVIMRSAGRNESDRGRREFGNGAVAARYGLIGRSVSGRASSNIIDRKRCQD
jgi:hypothetical protein